jgi:hypothetical protein
MDPSLESKLAQVLDYVESRAHNKVNEDGKGLMSYLDDPEVAGWLTRMRYENRVWPNRFINGRR